jgi:hypothetical protein
MGYGNAAALIAWRGACLGQKARHPLSEGARCARKQAKRKRKVETGRIQCKSGLKCVRREHLLGRNLRVRQHIHLTLTLVPNRKKSTKYRPKIGRYVDRHFAIYIEFSENRFLVDYGHFTNVP